MENENNVGKQHKRKQNIWKVKKNLEKTRIFNITFKHFLGSFFNNFSFCIYFLKFRSSIKFLFMKVLKIRKSNV